MRDRTIFSQSISGGLLSLTFLILSLPIFGQGVHLYGATSFGGAEGLGTIYRMRPDGSRFELVHSVKYVTPGLYPYGSLVAYNGKFYGMTNRGGFGPNSVGVIFSYEPTTQVYTKLKDFNTADGFLPNGSLIAYNGKLYGMTSRGGTSDCGVIFAFDPATNTYTKLKDFMRTDGAEPSGDLLEHNGKLYGMTPLGGTSGYGVLFSIDPTGANYLVLRNFSHLTPDGMKPYGSLVQYNGLLFGMTNRGGAHDMGVIFSFNPANDAFTVLKNFIVSEGVGAPRGSLCVYGGKLYGMTSFGEFVWTEGSIFSFDPVNRAFVVLKILSWSEGAFPYGSLIEHGGKLYGMTNRGASNDSGTLFSLDLNGNVFTVEKNFFSGDTGRKPRGSLIKYNGKLYGLTSEGGANSSGALFSFDPAGRVFTKLVDFNEVQARYLRNFYEFNGKLYGLSVQGGKYNYGVIFSFDPVKASFTKLKDFDYYTDGASPCDRLIDYNGKLYGMTTHGGGGGSGTIYSFNPGTGDFTTLKIFNFSDGANPQGSLVESNGKLYGVTYRGGAHDFGVIFSIDPVSLEYTKLKDFGSSDGVFPYGRLIAFEGKLYGMTSNWFYSGSYSTLFSFDPTTRIFDILHTFNSVDDAHPFGGLLEYNGNLFGMSDPGGPSNSGVLFSYQLATRSFTKLIDFNSETGVPPIGSLIEYKDKLYGTTSGGGTDNNGVAFCYNPADQTYLKIHEFTRLSGAPSSDLIAVRLPMYSSIENMIAEIVALGLNGGFTNSLTVKLKNALQNYEQCLLIDAVNLLEAFMNQVTAARKVHKIPTAAADALIAQAQELIDAIVANGNPDCVLPAGPAALRSEGERMASEDAVPLSIFPNPSNRAVTIHYRIPEEGRITLHLYNLQGRLVRTLESGTRPAGSHQTSWDGLNNASIRCEAGIYLLCLQTDEGLITKRLIRTK